MSWSVEATAGTPIATLPAKLAERIVGVYSLVAVLKYESLSDVSSDA